MKLNKLGVYTQFGGKGSIFTINRKFTLTPAARLSACKNARCSYYLILLMRISVTESEVIFPNITSHISGIYTAFGLIMTFIKTVL